MIQKKIMFVVFAFFIIICCCDSTSNNAEEKNISVSTDSNTQQPVDDTSVDTADTVEDSGSNDSFIDSGAEQSTNTSIDSADTNSDTNDVDNSSDNSNVVDTDILGDEQLAFPGALGFGRYSTGGRGGDVYKVTTLADSGAGSLRHGITSANGPRTIVFDVGGWITLSSNLGIVGENLTIAGQTAPGDGIGVRGRKVSTGGKNIIIRHMRFKNGIITDTSRDDAFTINSSSENVILDHCTIAYGKDENIALPGNEGIGPRNVTIGWSIIAWGLQRNNHSAGALLTSNQITIHHTLWAFNKTRNPRARSEMNSNRGQGGPLNWINNVIYGWDAPDPVGEEEGWNISNHPFILAGTTNGEHMANAIGNYFISRRSASYAFVNGTPNFSLYFANNLLDGNANGVLDVSKSETDMISGNPTMLQAPIGEINVPIDAPLVAFGKVMASAGPAVPTRDEADALLVSQVENQTGILIQSERDLEALGIGDMGYGTLRQASREPGYDSDGDGIPDYWELANNLDPNDPNDGNLYTFSPHYTNLEVYLNQLAHMTY